MTCADYELFLNAMVDGELGAGERADVDAHLASCEGCRRTLEAIRAQHLELDTAFGPERRATEALADRVIRAHRRPRFLLLASAAAAFFILLAFVLLRERQVADLRERLVRAETSCQTLEKQLQVKKPPAARLALATGVVERRATPQGDWEAVGPGGGLEEGTWIRTADRSKCSFDCADGTELRLNGATEICLEKPRTVRLARGEIFTRVAKDSAPYTVTTDQAMIEALGTSLNIVHRPAQSTVLTVIEGKARMAGVAVASGYLCRVVEGKVQPPVAAYELAMLTKWVNEIVALKGRDSPELQVRVNQLLAQIGRTKMEHLVEAEIRALGDHAALPLTCYIQSPESQAEGRRRRDAARILADIASSPSVPDFVALLADQDPEVRVQVARGLERLTGETLGFDAKYWAGADVAHGADAWKTWLKANEATWSAPRGPKK
jgi:ferric-dicitrate binding protein FerR (iron transport regulator)